MTAYFQPPVTIQTLRMGSNGIRINYPNVMGLPNKQIEYSINQEIYHTVMQMLEEQKKVQTGSYIEMTGGFELKNNQRGILSLTLSNYGYSYPMAHGFTILRGLTFDLNTGKLYQLGDLFKPGSAYEAVLTGMVKEQIKERELPVLDDVPHIVYPDQSFYLADKSLVLFYPLYELSPYYVGFPMFPISVYALQDIILEQGPLGILSADIA